MSNYEITLDGSDNGDHTAVQLWKLEGDKRMLVDSQTIEPVYLPPAQQSSLEYIRRVYEVPAYVGFKVRYQGKPGVIVGANGCYLLIKLDGETEARRYHPTWEMRYFKEGL